MYNYVVFFSTKENMAFIYKISKMAIRICSEMQVFFYETAKEAKNAFSYTDVYLMFEEKENEV